MKYIALIPSYEPNHRLVKILQDLKNDDFEIIVVNDGSSDKYNYIFKECEKYAKVLGYSENRGKGYALKTGLSYIKEEYSGVIVVTVDSDGQHSINDAKKLCNLTKDNTIMLGKRLRGKNTPLRSKLGNNITRFFFRISTGIDIYDTQTGLRAFKDDLIPFMLDVEGNRFEYEMNVLLAASKAGITLKEEVIETIYEDNNSGSHFNTIRDSYLIYKQLFKFIGSSFTSFILDYLLYILMLIFTNNIIISNIVARFISCNFNYMLNKKIVFNDDNNVSKTIFKYYGLAIMVMLINTVLLTLLVSSLLFNKYIAKILIEVLLFTISWIVQKRFIFKGGKNEKNKSL